MTDDWRFGGETGGDRPADGRDAGPGGRPDDRDAGRDRRPFDDSPEDDLFVWGELRPPARRGASGAGGRDERRRAGGSDESARPGARDAAAGPAAREDWRTPEYPTGAGRVRRPPAPGDGYEVEEEWEEWLEPGGPHGPEGRGPRRPEAPGRPPGRGRGRRRRASAGAVLLAMLVGFFLAGLLDARGIEADVAAKPFGTLRSVQLALLKPMTGLSGLLRLDQPAVALNDFLGRGDGEHHSLAEVKPGKKALWPRKITRKKPLRLYVAGDSMDQVFGSSLVNLSEETKLVKAKNDYHVSSGLSRPDYYDWPQRLIDQIVEFKPDAAAVLFGANDGQDVLYDGKVIKVGTKTWQKVYAQRVGEAMDILTKGGRRVYWVGNPIMKDFKYRERIAMMNHIYEAEAKKHPGVTFVSTWAAMAKDGSYAEYLEDENGDQILMRAPDGIHLSRAGGDRMAQVVLDVIMRDWGMTGSASPSPDAE